jgi:DNA end-binding protein Ku
MKPYVAWKGALEIEVSGFPMAVSIELYSRVKKARNESFRVLAPSGQLREQQNVDPATGEVFDKEDERKGVKVGPHEYVPMTDDALAQIADGTKTEVLAPQTFAPLDTMAMDLAIDRFAVRPQDEVAGSDRSLNIVWNGLRDSGLAWLSQVSLRGGHDSILAIYADDQGMWAALLPFEDELYPIPGHTFEQNDKAASVFGEFLEQEQDVKPFDHSEFASEYRVRRQTAIDSVLSGKAVPAPAKKAAKKDDTADLMAALEASVSKAKKPGGSKKAKKAKVAA